MKIFILYFYNILTAIDQFANVLLLGSPDETISSRLGRAMQSGKPKWFVRPIAFVVNLFFRLFFKQKNHVLEYIEPVNNYKSELYSWIK